jgi:hypothetical protein
MYLGTYGRRRRRFCTNSASALHIHDNFEIRSGHTSSVYGVLEVNMTNFIGPSVVVLNETKALVRYNLLRLRDRGLNK